MSPQAIVAIILAASVGLWGVLAFVGLAWHGKQLNEFGGEALAVIGGGLVSALVAYLSRKD